KPRLHFDSAVLVGVRVLLFQPNCDGIQVGSSLLQSDASLESRDAGQIRMVAPVLPIWIGRQWSDRDPETHVDGKGEGGRHHANNRAGSSVQSDCLAHDGRFTAKPALPKRIAE